MRLSIMLSGKNNSFNGKDLADSAIPALKDFRVTENFFEVILEECPEAVMVFSVRMDIKAGLSGGSGDESMNAVIDDAHDYKCLSKDLAIDRSKIILVNQTHGSRIFTLDGNESFQSGCDAIISDKSGYYPAIRTADCQAILIIDPVRKVSAAVHAGWRGTVMRITRKVVLKLIEEYGSSPVDLIVGLGPSVGTCCYEVDDRVIQPLEEAIPAARSFVEERRVSDVSTGIERISRRLDLRKTNRQELLDSGVTPENIRDLNLCTSCNDRLFYSYRRDGANPGRLIALTGFRS